MKIAYLINQYPKVSHSFIRREILALERQGITVLRIALRGWDQPLPDEEDQRERQLTHYVLRRGVRGLALPLLQVLLKSPRRLMAAVRLAMRMSRRSERSLPYHLIYVAEACCVLAWTRQYGVSAVHAHFGTNSTEIAMLAHALGGPPYSFTVHGTDDFAYPKGLREKIARASFVVAVSSFARSQLYLHSRHAEWPKIQVVHCGLEPAFYAHEPRAFPPAPRLVCVGRLSEEKGQLLLIEAAAQLVAGGTSLELVLAGDGPMRQDLETLIRERSLAQHVRITGWLSSASVREEILSARALVLPSFGEGLPVVIMEAMSLRRPVLATYVAGIPELVVPGETGWLFPAGSVDALALAMEECLSLPLERLQQLGDAGFERVLARHAVDRESAKLASLFRMPPAALAIR